MKVWWKKSFLERHPILRIILNITLFIIAIVIAAYLYIRYRANLIVGSIWMFFVFCIPLLQRHGREELEKERVIAIYQFQNDQKINVNRKKIFISYIEMFIFYWILLFLAFLPPWPQAWAAIFFPTLLVYTLQIFMWAPTWDDFDYKMRYYYLIHFVVSVLCILLSLILKTILFPIE